MPDTTIYSRPFCPFCVKAERLLKEKGYSFNKIDISRAPDKTDEMMMHSGGITSVPQIILEGVYIGGFHQLESLLEGGEDVDQD